ncbi:MAG: site-specific integrase [Oscillospiraceae bacterium]|nr:site-specific integrase [Oscillospiraceae bacterium]
MSKRRASGEGSIRKRSDGRWEGRYVAGHDEAGKPIRRNVLGKTQAEVKEKLKNALEEAGKVDVTKAEEYTVGAWALNWYELYVKPNIRESTQRFYEGYLNQRVIPALGDIPLRKLTAREIQTLYNDTREHGRIRKEQKEKNPGLSAAYVRGLHTMLHGCLDRAVKEHLIPRNPCDDCVPPKAQKQEMQILPQEDIRAYLREAERRGVLAMFFLELCTGLRKGELTALLWEDLDTERRTLRVDKQAVAIRGGGVKVTRPKTETSVRTLSVSREVIRLLEEEHAKHPENPYMFPSPVTGGMYYPDTVNSLHEKILKGAGLKHIRLHDMRHTAATLMLQNGVDIKTVSGMLGHYDAGFTLRTYTHSTDRQQAEAADMMGSLVAQSL